MPARINVKEGEAFTDSTFTRRVVAIHQLQGKEKVVYSKGGDRLYQCGREQYLRFRRNAVEVTDCTIAMHDGGLLAAQEEE